MAGSLSALFGLVEPFLDRLLTLFGYASKKWTMPLPKWKPALNHLAILFEERLPN